MLEGLELLVRQLNDLNTKLILVVGAPRSGKTILVNKLARRRQASVLNVGLELGRGLVAVPTIRRHLEAPILFKVLADSYAAPGVLVLDNIELLFDRALQLNPLGLLRRHAHARLVVAVWPGELRNDRLSYATTGHPEHQDYGTDGLVPFKIH